MNKLILALLFPSALALRAAQTFDPAADFSTAENPHGVWTYGFSETLGSELIPLPYTLPSNAASMGLGIGLEHWYTNKPGGDPLIARNPASTPFSNAGSSVDPASLVMHPGVDQEYAVLRFTAPQDGSYTINGAFSGQNASPTTTDVHILVNAASIFDAIIQGFGPPSGQPFSGFVSIKRGDVIDFCVGVGPNNNWASDLTGLDLKIRQTVGVFDAKSEFSATTNPSASWSYGYSQTLDSPFTSFSIAGQRGAIDFWTSGDITVDVGLNHNPDRTLRVVNDVVVQPYEMILQPGPSGEYSIVRWTAPSAGKFLVNSSFVGEGGASTVDVHVLQNGQPIFDGSINRRGKRSSFSSVVSLAAGDTLDFAVGYGADQINTFDATGLDVLVRPVTQAPATDFAIRHAVELSWPGEPGGVYQIQSAPKTDSLVWQNVNASQGSDITNLFQTLTGPTLFYRLVPFK